VLVQALQNQRNMILKWIVLSLPILWLIPVTIAQIQDLTRPHTYALAQAWFEENAPEETLLWTEGYETNRSLSRYEAGYSGFNTYSTMYASDIAQDERTWDGDFEQVDYIFLNEVEKQTWSLVDGVPSLQDLPLLKKIGDSSTRGPALYIYGSTLLPNPQTTYFQNSETILRLRGVESIRENNQFHFWTWWQASETAPNRDYSYFIHITPVDDSTTILAQIDGQLGSRPTSTWTDSHEILSVPLQNITVPPDLPEGEYAVRFGIYYWEDGERFR
jgi:hypothetical protein